MKEQKQKRKSGAEKNGAALGKTVSSMIREAIVTAGYKDVKECARKVKVPYDLFNKVVGGHIPKDSQLLEYAKKLKIDSRELLLVAYREKAPAEVKQYFNSVNLLEDHSTPVKELLGIVDGCNSDQLSELLAVAKIIQSAPRETSRKALALVTLYQQLDEDTLEHFDSLVLMALRNNKAKGINDFKEAIEHAKTTSSGRSARLHN